MMAGREIGGFEMSKVDELKKYITEQGIKYQVNEKSGVWYVRFADMTYKQQHYIMSPYFSECGFSGMTGIHF